MKSNTPILVELVKNKDVDAVKKYLIEHPNLSGAIKERAINVAITMQHKPLIKLLFCSNAKFNAYSYQGKIKNELFEFIRSVNTVEGIPIYVEAIDGDVEALTKILEQPPLITYIMNSLLYAGQCNREECFKLLLGQFNVNMAWLNKDIIKNIIRVCSDNFSHILAIHYQYDVRILDLIVNNSRNKEIIEHYTRMIKLKQLGSL